MRLLDQLSVEAGLRTDLDQGAVDGLLHRLADSDVHTAFALRARFGVLLAGSLRVVDEVH